MRGEKQAAAQPPASKPASKSQAPLHGQGIGLGLAILSLGSKPGGQQGQGPNVGPVPSFHNATTTAIQNGGGATTYALTMPTYSAGDIVLACFSCTLGFNDNNVSATGWTKIVDRTMDNVSSGHRLFVLQRVMAGNEGASVTFSITGTFAGNTVLNGASASYTGVPASNPTETPVMNFSGSGSSSWSVGPLTTAGNNRRVVTVYATNSGNVPTFANGTQRAGLTSGTSQGIYVVDVAAATAGNYSNNGSAGAFTFWAVGEIAVKPNPS